MPVRLAALGLLTVAYLLATQWLMTTAPASPWTPVGLLTPMLAAAALAARQAGQTGRAALAVAAIAGLCAGAAAGVEIPAPRLYLAQHVAVNAALGVWFAGTLKGAGPPLIASLAERVHGPLSPAMARYTRQLTGAWASFFALTAAASIAVYLALPFDAWAAFSNIACPMLIGAMFVGERLLRYRLHPEFDRASLADQVRAWRQHGAAREAERRNAAG